MRCINNVAIALALAAALVFSARAVAGQLDNHPVKKISGGEWQDFSKTELVEISKKVLAMPDVSFRAHEEIIRIRSLGMDWDIASMVYEPDDLSKVPTGADGKKVGLFFLHGGSSDHRSMDKFARFLVSKFGYKIVAMSYPGRLYLGDDSRDWPGDTMNAGGSVRTPNWLRGEVITPDQYELVQDREESRRRRWGTLFLACAREGTTFYDRMAGWPVAFEEGGRELLGRFLPEAEYSIYAHGHSTGGPFAMIFSQRIPNLRGIVGMESSPFGALYGEMTRKEQEIAEPWDADFNCLRIRSWRDTARYYGYELIQEEGVAALERLAMVMEEVLEDWSSSTRSAQFKAENIIHFDSPSGLENAARATARRLKLAEPEARKLVDRYVGYLRELSGPGTRPVPPLLLIITNNSRDHTVSAYQNVYMPAYAAMKPAPKVRVVHFDGGIHGYTAPEKDLPMGVAPIGALLWHEAITGGYYTSPASR
jgi:pimeloyl-ACP methyl ester carboxylesterase